MSALKSKTAAFSIRVVKLHDYLTREKKEYVMSKQVIRSGTNPGAMVREAFNAESDRDFIHKLKIGQKEAAEAIYWLKLLFETEYLNKKEFESIHTDAVEVLKLLKSSIMTKRRNMKK